MPRPRREPLTKEERDEWVAVAWILSRPIFHRPTAEYDRARIEDAQEDREARAELIEQVVVLLDRLEAPPELTAWVRTELGSTETGHALRDRRIRGVIRLLTRRGLAVYRRVRDRPDDSAIDIVAEAWELTYGQVRGAWERR